MSYGGEFGRNKEVLWTYFVETLEKRSSCVFTYNKGELWIYFVQNAEINSHLGFILLKMLIKAKAVNLLKTKKSC